MKSGAIETLIERCRSLDSENLSATLTRSARHCLLDGFGVALLGAQSALASILRHTVGGGSTSCTILGTHGRARAIDAALFNGTSMHALDFDDTHLRMQGHPTAAILPAVLALAEEQEASHGAVLAACCVGVEVAATLGGWVNPRHYDAGWHATGTLGTVGAAAASAHLLQLEPDEWITALALAATQAAGVRGTFGSMAKPFHAGRAAASGLLSAQLAAAGFSCARAALDGSSGFLGIHSDLDRLEPPGDEEIWAIEEMLFKFHAACFMAQAAIQNGRQLMNENRLEVSEIESIELFVAPELRGVCDIAEPQDALEAKFSLQLVTALALGGADTADEDTYSLSTDATVRNLCRRVHVNFLPALRGNETRTRTIVKMRDDAVFRTEHDSGTPERDLEAQEAKLVAKFRSLAGKVLSADDVLALEEEILRCPSGSIVPALRLTTGVGPPEADLGDLGEPSDTRGPGRLPTST